MQPSNNFGIQIARTLSQTAVTEQRSLKDAATVGRRRDHSGDPPT
jgi:hypothetical protein